jgi:hypothetical protein
MSGKDGRALWMLTALRIVIEKDSGPFRQAVFDDVAQLHPAVRFARRVHRALGRSPLSTLWVGLYGLKAFLTAEQPRANAPVWAVAAYRNERRQFDWIGSLLPAGRIAALRIDSLTLLRGGAAAAFVRMLLHPRDAIRVLRIIGRINKRSDFLVACRAASLLGYAVRIAGDFSRRRPRAVLVSTDSNPYGLALAFAAKRKGIPSIYVTHGHIPAGPPRLHFDLSVLDGPALERVYSERAPIGGAVVYKGAEGEYRPMSTRNLRGPRANIGVFLSLRTDWPRLGEVLREMKRRLGPDRMVVRMHPNELVRPSNALQSLAGIDGAEISRGETILLADAARCDVVFAAGSSCHLTLLRYGVPTASVDGLDLVPKDFYGFERARIVPHFRGVEEIDLAAIAAFYEDPDWAARFGQFDASYPGRDTGPDVRAAIGRVVPEALA